MATKLQNLKTAMTSAFDSLRQFQKTITGVVSTDDAEKLRTLQENVTASQDNFANARKACYFAPPGVYAVVKDGVVVGHCDVSVDGEPIFTFNPDQTALVDAVAASAVLIAFGGSSKIINGEIDLLNANTIYLV